MITTRYQPKGNDRVNKIYVNTLYSSDGRYKEGYWMDYGPVTDPESAHALFLLELTLNTSELVEYYQVYDNKGELNKNFNSEKLPKRI